MALKKVIAKPDVLNNGPNILQSIKQHMKFQINPLKNTCEEILEWLWCQNYDFVLQNISFKNSSHKNMIWNSKITIRQLVNKYIDREVCLCIFCLINEEYFV